MSPFLAIPAVIAVLGLVMLGVRALQRNRIVGPEIGRKLVHAGMGIIALSFPWIFQDILPLWLLAGLAIAILGIVRAVPAVAVRFGQVLGGVDRASLGEIFFPVGVVIAFTLARGNAAAFCGGVAVLAFADTAGALIGTRWGRRQYSLAGGRKSLEGSVAVFVVAALCVAVAYAALDARTWSAALRGGFGIGLVVAVVEAVASYGLDNLLLPSVVVALMKL